ncbi:SPOR domain-containing protein [Pseudomonas sp. GOM7]|uniref:SPOR domain-containing protein n=1 Tax=Pseudomonas sp. GOM7 TaxID=2998079 RepID=UPI00227C22FF|nr:SPOR domain-containing protein [Pseudomonas sp. GOM7]WAJ35806.1 SPOR domain-containing protein [Pseudomonas sp. GOM7]
MALLEKGLKQRMVGALVLVALAVIFLPMLLSREDEMRRVVVDAPQMPQTPDTPEIVVEPAEVVEPEVLPQEPVPVDPQAPLTAETEAPAPAPQPEQKPAPSSQASQPAPAAEPAVAAAAKPESHLDASSLPISWSVQLASLSSRSGAETLQKTLRSQGYNAYIRTFDGMNRVFVGPLIERAEAERLRDQLKRQHKLNGFVVRFQPEAG